MKKLLRLFLIFLKIGAFTFGGGYAMIALLENEFVAQKQWLTKEEFMDMIAISESTPGPVAINSATFIGYRLAGVAGSAFCTLGVCLPSFVIIYIISLFFDRFLSLTYVTYAFKGIQACVVYLILSAGIKMLKGLKKEPLNAVFVSAVFIAMLVCSVFCVHFSTVFYILICGALGVFLYALKKIKKGGSPQCST